MKKFVGFAVFGLVACLTALSTPGAAQCCGRNYGWSRCDYGWSDCGSWRGYYGRGWRRSACCYSDYWAPYYTPCSTYYYTNAGVTYYGTYSAYRMQETPAPANAVTIQMHVPSDARVWIDGDATSQTGANREFVSPAVAPGQDYVYHIRVQWDANNKTQESTRDVLVHAGERINLDFGA
jgi:uncharacterized protein (TIGR03000 family)